MPEYGVSILLAVGADMPLVDLHSRWCRWHVRFRPGSDERPDRAETRATRE